MIHTSSGTVSPGLNFLSLLVFAGTKYVLTAILQGMLLTNSSLLDCRHTDDNRCMQTSSKSTLENSSRQEQRTKFTISEIHVSYHPKIAPGNRITITNSAQVSEILRNAWNSGTLQYCEEFKIMYLNRANRILGIFHHSKGTIDNTVMDVRQILGVALKANASGFILCHNHPSGSLTPSESDIKLTKAIVQCADLLKFKVLDHIIISCDGYYSFADEGML